MKNQMVRKLGLVFIAFAAVLFTFNSCNEDDDDSGSTSEVLEDLQVQLIPSKGFAFEGEQVTFTFGADSIPNLVSSYSWEFEGASPSTSTDASPAVSYAAAGTYEATLTVTRTEDNQEFTGEYSMLVLEKPTTAFMADILSIEQGATVTFRSTSSSNDNLQWVFEGGSPETSTEPEVVVTYAAAGTFDVQLTSAENGSAVTTTETDYIEVIGQATPTFTASATTIDQRQSVTYRNTTPTTDATVQWTFTGGDITNSTENEIVVTYPDPGAFDVTLAVTKNGITQTLEETEFVTVEAADATLQSAETSLSGLIVTLTYDFPLNDPSAETIMVSENGMNATVSSIALDSADDTKINVTLAAPLAAGSAVLATYASPAITTTVGGTVIGFTDEAVTNNTVAGPAVFGVDIPNATAGSPYVSLAGAAGATASNNGVTFTINGPIGGGATRTRGGVTQEPVDLHEDFVFTGTATTMTLTISGLTGGQEYTVNSVHFEGNPNFPARMSVSLKDDAGATIAGPQIIDNNPAAAPLNGGPGPVDNISTTNFTFVAQAGTDYVIESVGQVAVVPDPPGGQGAGQNRNRFNAVLVTEGSSSSLTPPPPPVNAIQANTDPTFEDEANNWGPFPTPDGVTVNNVAINDAAIGNSSSRALSVTTPTAGGGFGLFSPPNSIVVPAESQLLVRFDYRIPPEWVSATAGTPNSIRINFSNSIPFGTFSMFVNEDDLTRDGEWHTYTSTLLGPVGGEATQSSGRANFQITTDGPGVEILLDNFTVLAVSQ